MQIFDPAKNNSIKNSIFYFLFVVLSVILFWPVLSRNFVSDDFFVLYRIIYKRNFYTPGFFRPLSDISLYSSYLFGGLNPLYFNLFNVIIHGSCGFLLYRICLTGVFEDIRDRKVFAWITALLFLIYPFHNEAVIWAIGRGIVLSGFFALLSMLMAFTNIGRSKKYILACLFYFISMCGYETVFPLPLIVLLLLYNKEKSIKKILPLGACYFVTLAANIWIRLVVNGSILDSYSNRMVSLSLSENCIKFLKATARLVLPPSQYALLLSVSFVFLLGFFLAGSRFIFNKRKALAKSFLTLVGVTFISNVIPSIFGINTKTFEGDRVFYFSSFFLCILISWLISLVANKNLSRGAGIFFAGYFLIFFYQNVFIWRKASLIATNIVSEVSLLPRGDGITYLLNIPDEYHGAQVLRNGFMEALLMRNIDTSGIRVVSFLSTAYAEQMPGSIVPVEKFKGSFVFPGAFLTNDSLNAKIKPGGNFNDSMHVKLSRYDKIFYWNKESLMQFIPVRQ